MEIELDKLKAFYTIVKSGTFTKAADILNISQSALSRAIQQFEYRIGTKLIIRSPQELKLTIEGKKLYDFAERTLKDAEALANQFNDNSNEAQGKLKISTMPATAFILMKQVPEFLKLSPKVEINIHGNLDTIDLSNSDVIVRPMIKNDNDLIQIFLFKYFIRLYASKAYLDKNGIPKSIKDLEKHRLIGYSDSKLWKYAQVYWVNKLGQKPWAVRETSIQVSSSEIAVAAAESDLGIIEISDAYKNCRCPHLIEVLPTIDHPIGEVYYIFRKEFKKSKRITSFGEYLSNLYKIKQIE